MDWGLQIRPVSNLICPNQEPLGPKANTLQERSKTHNFKVVVHIHYTVGLCVHLRLSLPVWCCWLVRLETIALERFNTINRTEKYVYS